MKALLLSNQARSMSVFWRVLIKAMLARGWNVTCCVPPGDEASEIELRNIGAHVINFSLDRKGLNPLADIDSYLQLRKIFSGEHPDLLFATTIKPVIYGCLAARSARIRNIFATITGLGYVFEQDSLPKKIINRIGKNLYRLALRNATGIFFQNRDDFRLFKDEKILGDKAKILFARGTGVDISHFQPAPFPDTTPPHPIVFLLIGRLLEAKGIEEYAKAAKKLRAIHPNSHFRLLGPAETGRGSLDPAKIRSWAPDIEYLGEARDVRPHIAAAHVIVLPSWREGTPTSIMEAMAMGRPCVVTDVPGCREVVKNGENGFLCEARNPDSLARAMREFLDDPGKIATMGAASRKIAEAGFDARKVAEGILDDMIRESE